MAAPVPASASASMTVQSPAAALDPLILRLWDLGFALSARALHLLGAPPQRPPAPVAEHLPDPAAHLHDFAQRITAAIEELIVYGPAPSGAASERVETTKLEELQYRARSLVLLLFGDKREEARRYSDMLAESIVYLSGRLDENRPRWIGLWLGAKALHLVARAACGADTEPGRSELRTADERARAEVLDRVVPLFVREGGVPWPAVAAFVYGEPNELLRGLIARLEARRLAPPPSLELTREEILTTVSEMLGGDPSLYRIGSIPEKKLGNARQTCAADPDDEILALLDCTVFGSAKDAVLFGARCLYYFNAVASDERPGRVAYSELPARSFTVNGFEVSLGEGPPCNLAGGGISTERFVALLHALRSKVLDKQRG